MGLSAQRATVARRWNANEQHGHPKTYVDEALSSDSKVVVEGQLEKICWFRNDISKKVGLGSIGNNR